MHRAIGDDLSRLIHDAGATKSSLARVAAVDRTYIGRIEAGEARPSLETLVAIGAALGADVSVRIYGGAGPRLTDRHQARMVECVLRELHPVWRPLLEVPVWRPVRGVVDAVFERADHPCVVVTECISTLARLEQQLRWSAEKCAAIGSADPFRGRDVPPTSRLLILRSTVVNRDIARSFEETLRAAYPASSSAAVRSLTSGDRWPGDAIIWIRMERGRVELIDGAPRGVRVGR